MLISGLHCYRGLSNLVNMTDLRKVPGMPGTFPDIERCIYSDEVCGCLLGQKSVGWEFVCYICFKKDVSDFFQKKITPGVPPCGHPGGSKSKFYPKKTKFERISALNHPLYAQKPPKTHFLQRLSRDLRIALPIHTQNHHPGGMVINIPPKSCKIRLLGHFWGIYTP